MPNTIEQVLDYARTHPTRDGKSWAGWCESFVWRAGGFNGSFGSAMLAGNTSGPLNPNWGAAPRGAIHYWAGVGGDGHVAFELGGGTLLMASSRTSNLGTALGTIHFTQYGLPLYRGWSLRHGVETLASTSAAALSTSPLPQSKPELTKDTDMQIKKVDGGTIALVGEFSALVYGSATGGNAFSIGSNERAFGSVSGMSPDEMTTIVREAQVRRGDLVRDVAAAVIKSLPASTGGAAPAIDYAALAKAVNDDAARRLAQ